MDGGKAAAPPTALIVKVKQCRDLYDTQLIGKMNPYVEVTVGSKKKKTNTHSKGGRFPEWDEVLTFTYDSESSINFKVSDNNMIGSDYIGCHDFLLQPVVDSTREWNGELQLTRSKGRAAGYVDVALKFVGEVGGDSTDLGHQLAVDTRRAEKEASPPPQPAAAPAPVAPYQAAGAAAETPPPPPAAVTPPPVAPPVAGPTVIVNQAAAPPTYHQHFAAPPAPVYAAPVYGYPPAPYGYPPAAPYPYAAAPPGYAPYGAAPPAYGYPPYGGYRPA